MSRDPAPAAGAAAPLRTRIAALRAELGPTGVAAIAWSRVWMALAGVPLLGPVAVRLAAAACRPYHGRHRLARYHRRGFVAPGARLSHRGLTCGRNVFVAEGVVVYADAGGGPVTLGDRVHLNELVTIVTADGGAVSFDDDVHVQPGCYFMAVRGSIRVGRNSQIAPNCAFYPYEHGTAPGQPMRLQPIRSEGDIVLEDDVWLGYGVIVLSGVSIGAGAVVGAGSVVTKSVPAGAIAVGSPARVVRDRG